MGHLALIDYLNGWPGRAEDKALEAVTETERFSLDHPSGSGIERLVLAAVAVDRNELGRAQALLDEAAELPAAIRDPVTAAGRAIATARLQLARGDPRAAVEAAAQAVSTAAASPWAESHEVLVVSAAHLAEGRSETAAELLRAVPGSQPACAVEAARLHLVAGCPDAAIDLLDSIRADSRTGPGVTVRAALVRAQAAHGAGTRPPPAHSSRSRSFRPGTSGCAGPSSKPDSGSALSWPPHPSSSWPRAGSCPAPGDMTNRPDPECPSGRSSWRN